MNPPAPATRPIGRRTTLVLIAIAIAAAAFGVLAVVLPEPRQQVEVIAARVPIAPGATVTDHMVLATYTALDDTDRAVTRDLVEHGVTATRAIPAGTVLTDTDVQRLPGNSATSDVTSANGANDAQSWTATVAGPTAAGLALVDAAMLAAVARRRRTRAARSRRRTEKPPRQRGSGRASAVRAIAVEVDPDGRGEILWAAARPRPQHGWTTVNGGHSWITPPATTRAEWPNDVGLLVALGYRDGRVLSIDADTAGIVTIDGPTAVVRSLLDRIRTDLAGVSGRPVVEVTNQAAVHELAGVDSFVAVAEAAHVADLAQLIARCTCGSGRVLIASTRHTVGEHIRLRGDGTAEWTTRGIAFTPMVADADTVPDRTSGCGTVEPPAPEYHSATPIRTLQCDHAPGRRPSDDPGFDVLVRVLGEVDIEGGSERLTPAELELVTILAALRVDGPINIDRLTTLLSHDDWTTAKTRSIQVRLSHVRRKLGSGADGQPLLPDSRTATGHHNRYRLSDRVVTDLDLLEQATATAGHVADPDALQILYRALQLVRGRPFTAAAGYSWAHDEQASQRANSAIGAAVDLTVAVARRLGDDYVAEWAAQRGRRSLE